MNRRGLPYGRGIGTLLTFSAGALRAEGEHSASFARRAAGVAAAGLCAAVCLRASSSALASCGDRADS